MTDTVDLGREPKDLRIGDRWFVDLDAHVDIQGFNDMFPLLCKGVAQSMKLAEPVVIGSRSALYTPTDTEVTIAMEDNKGVDPILADLMATDKVAAYEYAKYRYPTVALGRKILLRTYNNYHAGFGMKHLARLNHDTPAYANFQCLRDWLAAQSIFSEIGRIIIFLTERDARAEMHCDYADGKSRKDQFLWLNPNLTKKFFVLDTEFKKHYLTGVANTFDSASWHGGDPSPRASFTIRVDGRFSRPFLAASGLDSHFSQPVRI